MTIKESDLYPPLKNFLTSQGYSVKGEIRDCDVVAIRDSETPVIVELKQSLTLSVILQAVDRLSFSTRVYIAIYRKSRGLKDKRHRVIRLLKMLSIGLIVIDPQRTIGSVEVLVEPSDGKPVIIRKKNNPILKEFIDRKGDPVVGGISRKSGIMTAYRQMALAIACYLEEKGESKASVVSHSLKIREAQNILYRNVYGWFERKATGIYALSDRGKNEIPSWKNQ